MFLLVETRVFVIFSMFLLVETRVFVFLGIMSWNKFPVHRTTLITSPEWKNGMEFGNGNI